MYNSLRWLFKPGNSYKGKAEGIAYSLRLSWANFRGLDLIVDKDNETYQEHENFYKCRQEATFEQASDWIAVGQHNYLSFLIAALAVSQEFSMLATLPWALGLLTAQAFIRVFFNQYELWNSRNKNLNKIVKTTVNTLILSAGIVGLLFIGCINVAATATIVSLLPAVIFAFSAIRFAQNTIYAIHNGIMWRYYAWKASIQKLKPRITTNPDTITFEEVKENGVYSFLMKGYLSFTKFIKKLNPFAEKTEEIEQEDMVKNTLYLHLENEKLAYHVFTPAKKIQSYGFPEVEELSNNIPLVFLNLTSEEQSIIEKLQLLQEYEHIEAQRNAGNNFAPTLKAIQAKIDKEGIHTLSSQETAIYYTALQRKNNRSGEENSFFHAHRKKIALLDSDYQAVFNNIHIKTLAPNSQPFSAIESAFIERIVQNRVTYGIESTPHEAALISLIIQEKMKRKEEPSHDEMQFILREAVNRGHVFDAAFEAERFRTQCIKRILQAAGNGGGAIFSGLILFAAPVSKPVLFIGGITAGCVNTVVQFYSATREFQRFRPIYLLRWLIGDVDKRINELNNESLGTKIKRYETSYQESPVPAEANTSETAGEDDTLIVGAQQTSSKSNSWWPFKKSTKQPTPKTFWHHSALEQEIQAIHNLSDNRASLAEKQATAILLLLKIINETIQTLDPQDSTHHYKIEFLTALKNVLLGKPGKLIGDDGKEHTITNFHNYKKNATTGKYEYDLSGNIDNFERFFDKNRETAKKIFQARIFKKSNVAGIYWGVTEYTQSFLDNPKYSTEDETPEVTKLIKIVDENTVSNKLNELIKRAKTGELDKPVCTHSDVQRTLLRESESSANLLPLEVSSSSSSEHPTIPSQKRPLKWGVLDIHALNELREDVSEEARKEYYLKKYGRTTELKWGSQNFNSAGCFLSEVRPHLISTAKEPSTLNPLAEGYDFFDDSEELPNTTIETLKGGESPGKPPIRRNSSRFSGQTDNTGSTSSLGIGREGVTPSPGREWLHSPSSPRKKKTLRSNSVEEVTSLSSFPSMNSLTAGAGNK